MLLNFLLDSSRMKKKRTESTHDLTITSKRTVYFFYQKFIFQLLFHLKCDGTLVVNSSLLLMLFAFFSA